MTEATGFRVLLVEDSPVEATLATRMLSGRDGLWTVHTADRLSAALTHLTQQGADVVLLDLNLPDSKGLDTVSAIQRHAPDTPLVVLTATDDDDTCLAILRRGAQDYIVKRGWGSAQLSRTLRHAVERHRAARALRDQERRFPPAFRHGPLGLSLADGGLKLVEVNETCCRDLGYARAELLALSLPELTDPENRDRDRRFLAEVLAGRVPAYRAETHWLGKQGVRVAMRLSGWRTRDDEPHLLLLSEKLAEKRDGPSTPA
jgi:two-component system, NarL family, sensor histidine kinase UhpB